MGKNIVPKQGRGGRRGFIHIEPASIYSGYRRYKAIVAIEAIVTIEAIARENNKNNKSDKNERAPPVRGAPWNCKRGRLPTLPHCIAVPSAQAGLTSLFGMGRGGTPPR